MPDMQPPLSRSQIDRLGDRLKRRPPSETDLELLSRYQQSLAPLYLDTLHIVAAAFRSTFPAAPFEPSARDKQVRSIIAKLQRTPTRLSTVQDLVGFRVVVPTVRDQDRLLAALSLDNSWRLDDRRTRPSHGYRAVHLIRSGDLGSVEVQVRTILQHQWAELSEYVDRLDPGAKYGQGSYAVRGILESTSAAIARVEEQEVATGSPETRDAETILAMRQDVLDRLNDLIPLIEERLSK